MATMTLIGLTGGIGSGKSTVAKALGDRGLTIVDADKIAREIVEPGSAVLGRLAERFGEDILRGDGSLDRAKLAAKAFATPEDTEALNAITHPEIRRISLQRIEEAQSRGENVVYDMPLLIELGFDEKCDLTLVVIADAQRRVERLVSSRGMSEADARQRMSAQLGDEERKKHADVVIDNNGSLEELLTQVDRFVATL